MYYVSNSMTGFNFQTVIATDTFTFKLIDSTGAVSKNVGIVTIDILSSLVAVNLTADQGNLASAVVKEEIPTAMRLRGANVRGLEGGPTWFVITRLPTHGKVYQYNSSNLASYKGQRSRY